MLKRLTDTRVYGNEYSVAAMLTELTDAIFGEDLEAKVNTFRQNLQIEYVQRLLNIVHPGEEKGYDHVAQSMALNRLRWIESQVGPRSNADVETAAHHEYIRYRIKRGLDELTSL